MERTGDIINFTQLSDKNNLESIFSDPNDNNSDVEELGEHNNPPEAPLFCHSAQEKSKAVHMIVTSWANVAKSDPEFILELARDAQVQPDDDDFGSDPSCYFPPPNSKQIIR